MRTALAALLLATPAATQLTAVVGPPQAPIFGDVAITFSNDTLVEVLVDQACPFSVRDSAGALVYDLDCPTFAPIPIAPGDAFTFFWQQIDNTFGPVDPGDYVVTAELPDGTTSDHAVTVGGEAGVHLAGTPKIGTTRSFWIQAPQDPGAIYLMAASTQTSPGIPTCGGLVPLFPSSVFWQSLDSGSTTFVAFSGVLGFSGESPTPALAIPAAQGLVGLPLSFSFVALQSGASCEVQSIAPATTIVIEA